MKMLNSIAELSQMSVLYVEDDKELAEAFKLLISRYVKNIHYCENGYDGVAAFKKHNPDIIITDITMPIMSGLEMSKKIRELDDEVPIIIVSAYNDNDFLLEAFQVGITHYINKPVNKLVLLRMLNESAKSVVYKRQQAKIIQNYEDSIEVFIDLIERRDRYTAGHSTRVAKYSVMIAKEMGISEEDCNKLEKASKLHDIGKIEIPDSILLNPSKLNSLEYTIVQEHLDSGYAILSKIEQYQELAEIMRYHHEKYDGTGYSQQLKGDEIPILSAIMMVADVFDAMTTNRIYKPRKSIEEALNELNELSGTFFSPKIIPHAIKALKDVDIDSSDDQMPTTKLEQKKFAYFFSDLLSGLYNENYLQSLIKRKSSEEHDLKDIHYVTIFDLHNFSHYNKKYGWKAGSELIKKLAEYLHVEFKDELLFRIQGDKFFILSNNKVELPIQYLKELIDEDDVYFDIDVYSLNEFLNMDYYM